jgi:phosphomannomutase
MAVFKAYDVRGKYPEQINETLARRVGRALADFLGNSGTVAIGQDMRPSSPALASAMQDGLHAGGVSTLSLGMVTSPTLYYVVGSRELAGGVMVTASHNPAGDNGFKLCREGVRPIGSVSGLKEIEAAVTADEPAAVAAPGTGESLDVLSDYLDHVLAQIPSKEGCEIKPLKIAFDCGNGVAGPTVDALLKRLPQIEAVKLFFEPDGTFPNHPANPIVSSNLVDVQAAVREHACDLGVAFDGDGDRVVFIDEKGKRVLSDLMTALLVPRMLADAPGAAVVYDLVSSKVVLEEINAAGGKPIEERVGHAFIKATMRKHNAVFAGENSGHYYWRDHWFADSALIALVRVLSLISEEGRPLARIVRPLRRTHQSGERNYAVEDKDASLEELVESFGTDNVTRMDGITIRMDGWWFNARKSNTEPVLRLNVEADEAGHLKEGLSRLESILGAPLDH